MTLGIDPGTAIMGYGLVASDGRSLQAVDYGALTTSSDLPPEERLRRLHERLCAIIAAHHPDAMAVEELFFNTNARTAIAVGQARGVALRAVPRPDDAADALAVAICHAHSARLAGLVGP